MMRSFNNTEVPYQLTASAGSLITIFSIGLNIGTNIKSAPNWVMQEHASNLVSFTIPNTNISLKIDDSDLNFSILHFIENGNVLRVFQTLTLKKGATQWKLYCDVKKFYFICDYSLEADWSDIRCYFFGELEIRNKLYSGIYGLIADFEDENNFFSYVNNFEIGQLGCILNKGFFTTSAVLFSKILNSGLINVLLFPNISDGNIYIADVAIGFNSTFFGKLPDFYVLESKLILEKPERICLGGNKHFSKSGVTCLDIYQINNMCFGFSVEF